MSVKVNSNVSEITIDKNLSQFVTPLSDQEKEILEQSLIDEGCRDPLVVWNKKNKLVLIDGHNRFEICEKLNIPYKILKKGFESEEEVKNWMVDNQLGRRNLTPDQLSYYRGLKYLRNKKALGGYENVKSKGQNVQSTAQKLAQEYNVSEKTIRRDAEFAKGLDILGRSNPKLKMKILTGQTKVNKSHLQALAIKDDLKITIKNEADLHNKAVNILRDLDETKQTKQRDVDETKQQLAQKYLFDKESLFISKSDRMKKIKGQILSHLNKAISTHEKKSIAKIRGLLDQLEKELLNLDN